MPPSLLLDTHILIRWLIEPKRLSEEQRRVIDAALRRGEPVAISSITMLETAILVSDGKVEIALGPFLDEIESNPLIAILPPDREVAKEVFHLAVLKDPADRAIVATARVHRLRLVTSDRRIVDSKLVSVVD